MYRVTEIIDFCYGHRLMHHEGKCAHLHGHNGRVEVEIAAPELDDRSMVADFSQVGQIVRDWLDMNIDHKLVLHRDDPLVETLRKHDEPMFLMDRDPTAEAIARLICDHAVSQGLPVVEVRLWETRNSVASYVPDTR